MKPDALILIDPYLLGELDETQAREVEARAAAEPAFARELERQKEILQGIDASGDERLRAQIAALDQALASEGFFENSGRGTPPVAPSGPGVVRPLYRWAAAATVVLTLGIGLWWWNTGPADSNLSKTATTTPDPSTGPAPVPPPQTPSVNPGVSKTIPFHRPAPPVPRTLALARSAWQAPDFSSLRGTAAGELAPLARAVTAFQKKDYALAMQLLRPLTSDDPDYWQASEVYAHAAFLSGLVPLATERFRQIAASGQLPFSERAEWFLLLCRLADFPDGRVEYEALLKKIRADEGHPYYEAAREISEKVLPRD